MTFNDSPLPPVLPSVRQCVSQSAAAGASVTLPSRERCRTRAFVVISISAVCAVLGGAAGAEEEQPTADLLLREFTGEVDPVSRSRDQQKEAYVLVIDSLIAGMGNESVVEREGPQQNFQTICRRAGQPGSDQQRATLCEAIAGRLGAETPLEARVWMLRQLDRIGGHEVVDDLKELLGDPEARVRECARRALQHNPDQSAGDVLSDALDKATDSDWQAALINALAARREASRVSVFEKLIHDADPAIASAAVSALGEVGNDHAVKTLLELPGTAQRSEAIADALLRCAQRRAASGEPDRALKIYTEVFHRELPSHLRLGALEGMAEPGNEKTLTALLSALRKDRDQVVRVTAARLLNRFPDGRVTPALVNELASGTPRDPVLLIETLADRGDRHALPTMVAKLDSDSPEVRIAALRALKHLGENSTVVVLAQAAADTRGEERQVARESLGQMGGESIDQTIIDALASQEDLPRAELIRGIRARRIKRAVTLVHEHVMHDDEAVRIESLRTLGALADEKILPLLTRRLRGSVSESERQSAEDAVVDVCRASEDREASAESILAEMSSKDSKVQASKTRILGRVRGKTALKEVRASLASEHKAVKDAAVRAIAAWDHIEVAEDLIELVRLAPGRTHAVLAYRGCIRLARESAARGASRALELLDEIAPYAKRTEDKRLLLSAFSGVNHPKALEHVQEYLSDEQLRSEAAVAVIKIARRVGMHHRDVALAGLERVRSMDVDGRILEQIEPVIAFIDRWAGYITHWVYAGPYFKDGVTSEALFDTVFPAEDASNEAVDWKPLAITNHAEVYEFDLIKAIGGTHRSLYVRTKVRSPHRQEVRLEIGSDDSVKVWLSDELVHANSARRGLTIAEDVVNGTLDTGWNTLLLKITNGVGGWSFVCAIKAPDGSNLDGLEFRAE